MIFWVDQIGGDTEGDKGGRLIIYKWEQKRGGWIQGIWKEGEVKEVSEGVRMRAIYKEMEMKMKWRQVLGEKQKW